MFSLSLSLSVSVCLYVSMSVCLSLSLSLPIYLSIYLSSIYTGVGCHFLLQYCCCCCCFTSVVSNSVQPHRRPSTRLLCPWDSPGKNTGVGCHFLLQWMKVKSEVTQSCLTLSDLVDCSLPDSPIHGILQERVLEWCAIAFSILLQWGSFKFCY